MNGVSLGERFIFAFSATGMPGKIQIFSTCGDPDEIIKIILNNMQIKNREYKILRKVPCIIENGKYIDEFYVIRTLIFHMGCPDSLPWIEAIIEDFDEAIKYLKFFKGLEL